MKLGQLVDYDKKILFFKNYSENQAGRLAADLLFFKASTLQLSFNVFR